MIDTLLLHTTNGKCHTACRFVPFPIILNNHEGHSFIARLFRCNSTNIYATFRTVSTDSARRAVPRRQLSFLWPLISVWLFSAKIMRVDIYKQFTSQLRHPRRTMAANQQQQQQQRRRRQLCSWRILWKAECYQQRNTPSCRRVVRELWPLAVSSICQSRFVKLINVRRPPTSNCLPAGDVGGSSRSWREA